MVRRLLAFILGLGFVSTTTSSWAEVPVSEEARTHFTAGVSFLQDPDGARYEEAYREFKAAYAASPSWKILGNLGIAAFKLERDGEAIDAFTKYLAEGGDQIDGEERQQFERDLQALRAATAQLTLDSEPPGATVIDERVPASGAPVLNRYGAIGQPTVLGLRPGHHRITAKLAGYQDLVLELDIEPRQQLTQSLKLVKSDTAIKSSAPPPASGGNGLRTASYVALGVGVVGIGVGTVFGLKAKSKYDDGNQLCPAFPCSLTEQQANTREQLGKDGDSAKVWSMVGFVAGGVGLAAGATLFILSGKKTATSTQQARVTPWVGLGAMGLTGSFQ